MLWWVVETTLVAAVLAAVAALVPRLRPLGPAARHALWLVVLIKLVTPPLLSWPWPVAVGVLASLPHDRGPIASDGDATPDREPTAATIVIVAGRDRADVAATETVVEGRDRVVDVAATGVDAPGPDRGTLGPRRPPIAALARALGRGAIGVWLVGSAALVAGQVGRIVRFRRRLRKAVPAPAWVAEEAARLGARLGVRVPELLVVPGLGVPMLWCLGRPRLLLPPCLVGTLGVGRWRCVLAHELAHVRRGDPWVGRLALVAGWLWWWNPIYRLARRRLDAEAELACDAWVVWALPGDRLVYAEALFEVSASLSPSLEFPTVRVPSPALGVTGAGRFLERRLTMILRDQVPCRLSLPALFGAGLLSLLSLPSWTVAESPGGRSGAADDKAAVTSADLAIAEDVVVTDDDDDDPPAAARTAPRAKKGRSLSETESGTPSPSPSAGKKRFDFQFDVDLSDLEEVLGPDSELVQALEKLGPEIEKVIREKLGPGSEFEKAMKEKLGPGSEFEKKMKDVGRKIEEEVTEKFGPGSEFEKKMKDLSERAGKTTTTDQDSEEGPKGSIVGKKQPKAKATPSGDTKPRAGRATTAAPATAAPKAAPAPRRATRTGRLSREQRIEELESKIDQLRDELKRLKEDGGEDDEKPR
jgi:beta-lactamase regulating signal transducer with metallopeptidase domain